MNIGAYRSTSAAFQSSFKYHLSCGYSHHSAAALVQNKTARASESRPDVAAMNRGGQFLVTIGTKFIPRGLFRKRFGLAIEFALFLNAHWRKARNWIPPPPTSRSAGTGAACARGRTGVSSDISHTRANGAALDCGHMSRFPCAGGGSRAMG